MQERELALIRFLHPMGEKDGLSDNPFVGSYVTFCKTFADGQCCLFDSFRPAASTAPTAGWGYEGVREIQSVP